VVLCVGIATLVLGTKHQAILNLPGIARMGIVIVLIMLPAFFMGMLFPLGLRLLGSLNSDAVPWAWGINGSVSVASAPLAAVLAVETGFVAVMFMAIMCYLITALSTFIRPGS
jgi:hypothetical protein